MPKQFGLKALTLWRPWPHTFLYGDKRIENRPWKPWSSVIGEWIAIHAGNKYDKEAAEWMRQQGLFDPPEDRWCPKGCIVGVARVIGYVEMMDDGLIIDAVGPELDPEQRKWLFGPIGWKLADVMPFDSPIACKGAQGLWNVTGDTLDMVRREYSKTLARDAQIDREQTKQA